MSPRTKKAIIALWYLALIFIAVDALLEWGYPRSTYYPGPWQPITQQLSLILVLATGIPMLLFLWRKTPGRKLLLTLMVATIITVAILAPNAIVSADRRAKAQWYINDLQSEGFTVIDAGSNYYRHGGGATRLDNYSDVAPTARAINCSGIQVRCGTPTGFLFYMGDGLQLVFTAPQPKGSYQYGGEYLYYSPYDPNRGIILLPTEPTPTPPT